MNEKSDTRTIAPPRPVVVLVDDELPVLAALTRLLRKEPYEVLVTTDPDTALEWIAERDVSLVIADERMPGMPGLNLLRAVRERSPTTWLAMLTGYPTHDMILERARSSIRRLLTKPWNDEDLKRTIRELVWNRTHAGASE